MTVALIAARSADEKHGADIVVLQVGDVLAITEYFVIVSASNRRLVRTLVDDIEERVRSAPADRHVAPKGAGEQQWVLVDYGDVVIHVFLDEIREFYDIERLYRDVPAIAWDGDEANGAE